MRFTDKGKNKLHLGHKRFLRFPGSAGFCFAFSPPPPPPTHPLPTYICTHRITYMSTYIVITKKSSIGDYLQKHGGNNGLNRLHGHHVVDSFFLSQGRVLRKTVPATPTKNALHSISKIFHAQSIHNRIYD